MSFWQKLVNRPASAANPHMSRRAGAFSDEDMFSENFSSNGGRAGAGRSRGAENSDHDRAYLTLLYEEHARLARQQETLRTAWMMIFFGMFVVLSVVGADLDRKRVCGAMLIASAALAIATAYKSRERFHLHLRAMRAYRTELGLTVRPEITALSSATRAQHNKVFRYTRLISPQIIWVVVCLAAATTGARYVWQASTTRYTQAGPAVPLSGTPTTLPTSGGGLPIQVPLGSELP